MLDRPFSPLVGQNQEREKEPFPATIISLGGSVHGSKGRGYLVYLPLGGGTPGQAYNLGRVQERAGTPVWVGWSQNQPVILHVDFSRMDPNGVQGYRSPLFAQHAPDHGWSSGDPLYVDTRQIKDLMVRPAGDFKVNISPGRYGNGLGYVYFAGQQNYDLAAYQPAVSGTKRRIGLYLDGNNTLQVVTGGTVAQTAVLPELNWPAGVFRLISFILFGSLDFIDFEYVKQEKALWTNPVAKVSQLTAADGDPDPAWSVDNTGNLSNPGGGVLDLNGVADALVLDADADTSLSSPTDDQIDIEVGGADRARFTNTALLLLTPTVVDLDGIADALVLDADADTSISAPTDDQIDFEAGGADIARIDGTGVYALSRSMEATWFDQPLTDTANASGVASHFRDNTATYPTGYTEVDAPNLTNTNGLYSFWLIRGASTDTAWKYRRILSNSLEALGSNEFFSFQFGPVLFRDGGYTADLDYIFGIYRNNAGAIDEQTYSRVRLHWNSGSLIWQIRGEEKDGTTAHNGSYVTLSFPLIQPLYIRCMVQNSTAKLTRQYVGTTYIGNTQSKLLDQNPTSAPTWGTPWVQIEMSRGAGVQDFLYLGAVDYLFNVA